ncbi:hypothetical protein MGG_09675 [Pyricularia oryzae 70-15]|uniref:Uncharacterized protein n=4 Tax=Pyricularia oryzae TaxID=318829 RepID=G4NKX7_PYRO7|nr:uncharacterized protein MGG_09675 [Pyricularia oryzae 70-15]EHA46669.1 hypothetical protein MGG_09675 [Pyricularia oryzae 70-15]
MQLSSALAAVAALALFPEATVAAGAKCRVDLKHGQAVVSSFEVLAGSRKTVKEEGFSWTCSTERDTCNAVNCILPKGLTAVGVQISSGKPKDRAAEESAARQAAAPKVVALWLLENVYSGRKWPRIFKTGGHLGILWGASG